MDFNLGGAYSSFTRTLDSFGTRNFPGRSTIESVINRGTSALLMRGATTVLGANNTNNINHAVGAAGIGNIGSLLGIGGNLPTPSGPKSSGGALSKAQGRPDPIMSWRWEAHIPGLPTQYIEDIVIPIHTFEVEPTFRGGSKTYYAKFVDISAFQLRLYADVENTAIDWLYQFFDSIRNKDGSYNYPKQYKKTIEVSLFGPNNDTPVCTFLMIGCFPISGSGYDLQSASSERVIISVEMSIDNMKMTTPGSNVSQSQAFSVPTSIPQLGNIAGFAAPLLQGPDTFVNSLGDQASLFLSGTSFGGFR